MSLPSHCQSFPFSASSTARLLIVGSMPGVRSIAAQEYYAHPHNAFWDIMGALFGAHREFAYAKRLQVLRKAGVALWDVASTCERPGSLDSDIAMATVVPNDFAALFTKCPRIRSIYFNGQVAAQLFRKLVLKDLGPKADMLTCVQCPSTSPAHASMTKVAKRERWRELLCHSD